MWTTAGHLARRPVGLAWSRTLACQARGRGFESLTGRKAVNPGINRTPLWVSIPDAGSPGTLQSGGGVRVTYRPARSELGDARASPPLQADIAQW